ncbi:MAG: matrixin family metalloprotease, partial [Acidobacteria bacterium]|nr:matrixin family metalloprotease [Acidobacteriota bacterium]
MKIQVVGLVVTGLLLAGGAGGQGTLGLKRGGERQGISWAKPKSRQAQRAHYLVELRQPPRPELLRSIEDHGQRVVSYVPVNGFILAVEGEPRLGTLDIVTAGPLEPADKLSREFRASRSGWVRQQGYVVEFHSDIPWQERRDLIQEVGLELRDHPDLVGDQMLVRGTVGQLEALVSWDEVAYVFPASEELMDGSPLIGCAGAITESGPVGALVQTVGEGWDGPGKGRASLQFAYRTLSEKVNSQAQQAEVSRALREWSRVIQVDFVEGNDAAAPRTIGILWGRSSHGDGYPFDGPGKVLAHTFYPAPPNSEPLAGDLHFDEDENWQVGQDIDVYSVALHELGHALGLGHSDVPGSVMYAYYRRAERLTAEDIGAARRLYGARDEAGTPPSTPTTPPSTPTTPPSTPTTPPSTPTTPPSTPTTPPSTPTTPPSTPTTPPSTPTTPPSTPTTPPSTPTTPPSTPTTPPSTPTTPPSTPTTP